MIVNQCVEQGIYVVLLLSLEKEHKPLRSTEMSTILSVSDSYLKKILRKLVVAGIIRSMPGKEGGFQLSRSVEEITLYDIYTALEGESVELKTSGIGSRIFIYGKDFAGEEEKAVAAFERAHAAFGNELRKMYLSELLSEEHYKKGTVDFKGLLESGKIN